jgi:anti-anti-sigma factor
MTNQSIPTQRNHPCKVSFHVEHRPCFLVVAIRGEASFDQAEVIAAQLLRIPLDAYSLVVLDLADLTFISSLAMAALVDYRGRLWRRGVEVRLANAQARVWFHLELAGLWGLFQPIDLEELTRPPAMGVA